MGKKTNNFTKEDKQIAKNTWKNAQHHQLLEKCRLKPPWDTTTHFSGWLKLTRQAIPKADKLLEYVELSNPAGGKVKRYSVFGKQHGSFLKVRHELTTYVIQPFYYEAFSQDK